MIEKWMGPSLPYVNEARASGCDKTSPVEMRESGGRDYFVLARVALENAIRNEDDVLALLPSAETPAAPAQRIYQSQLRRYRLEPNFQTQGDKVDQQYPS